MTSYIAVFLIGALAGSIGTIAWALCAANKREDGEDGGIPM